MRTAKILCLPALLFMFDSREQAGKLLADKLFFSKDKSDIIVLGIPRGGVVVAKVVAQELKKPLDIIVTKKIGAPENPELAIGAVGPGKTVFWDDDLCQKLGMTKEIKSHELIIKNREREAREKILRGNKQTLNLKNKTAILVDDGVATGATALAAYQFLKKMRAKKIILATPVIAKDTFLNIKRYFDEVIFLEKPEEFYAVGEFYREFPQVEDEEVIELLKI